jgi:hypothetical protein
MVMLGSRGYERAAMGMMAEIAQQMRNIEV